MDCTYLDQKCTAKRRRKQLKIPGDLWNKAYKAMKREVETEANGRNLSLGRRRRRKLSVLITILLLQCLIFEKTSFRNRLTLLVGWQEWHLNCTQAGSAKTITCCSYQTYLLFWIVCLLCLQSRIYFCFGDHCWPNKDSLRIRCWRQSKSFWAPFRALCAEITSVD